jgi:hypothetical protein
VKSVSFIIILLAGLVFGSVFAQNPGDQYPFASGKIEQTDIATKQITIKTPLGDRVFIVTNATYLIISGAKTSFDKLKPGMPVNLNYFTNEPGQAIIRRLKVAEPVAGNAP